MTQPSGQTASQAPTASKTQRSEKIWVVHAASRQQAAEALVKQLRAEGLSARAVRRYEGLRALAWERVETTWTQLRRRLLGAAGREAQGMLDAFRDGPPHLVVVDTVDDLIIFDRLRSALVFDARLVAWIDDLRPADAWREKGADALIAPTSMQGEAAGFGQGTASQTLWIGPSTPVNALQDTARRTAARKAMRIEDERVCLIDGSCLDAKEIPKIAQALSRVQTPLQTPYRWVFYYGDATYHADAMRAAATTHGLSLLMFGASTPVARVLPGCDVLLSASHSPLHDAAAWLGCAIVSYQTDGVRAPLAALGAMDMVQEYSALVPALRTALETTDRRPSIATHQALRHAGDAHAITESIATWLQTQLEHVPTPDVDAADTPDGFAFERVGDAIDANDPQKPLSPHALHAEITRIVAALRQLEREHTSAVEERDLWMERLQDAEYAQEEDLVAYAQDRIDAALKNVRQLQQQIAAKQEQRARLRAQVQQTNTVPPETTDVPQDMEARFQRIAQERQLHALKDRAKREGSSK